MMLNLYLVRFEDAEVKAGWRKVKQAVSAVREQSKPLAHQALLATIDGTATALRVVANATADAHDAVIKYRKEM